MTYIDAGFERLQAYERRREASAGEWMGLLFLGAGYAAQLAGSFAFLKRLEKWIETKRTAKDVQSEEEKSV